LEAGDVGQLTEPHLGELWIRIGGREQLVTSRGKLIRRHAARVLQLHRKTAGLAEAADGAGNQSEDLGVAQPAERSRRALDDRIRAVAAARSLVIIGEVDERLTRILARRALAAAGDGEIGFDVPSFVALEEIVLDLVLDLERAGHGSSGGKAELDE